MHHISHRNDATLSSTNKLSISETSNVGIFSHASAQLCLLVIILDYYMMFFPRTYWWKKLFNNVRLLFFEEQGFFHKSSMDQLRLVTKSLNETNSIANVSSCLQTLWFVWVQTDCTISGRSRKVKVRIKVLTVKKLIDFQQINCK